MSGQPSESIPATNTRRRAADRRARDESSSSVESDHFDATVVRRGESVSASYVCLYYQTRDPSPQSWIDFAVSSACVLIEEIETLRNRSRQHLLPSSFPQPSSTVASRDEIAPTPPGDAVLDTMKYCRLLPLPFANRSRESNWDCRAASRPFFLPPDNDTGFAATVLLLPHAAFASLPPPPFPHPLLSQSSVPPPMPSLPFAHESYPSLAPPPVCIAVVLDAADAAACFSVESECRCWSRLGFCGSKNC